MPDDSTPRVGDLAKDFELPRVDGGRLALAEARRSHRVVVHFVREFS